MHCFPIRTPGFTTQPMPISVPSPMFTFPGQVNARGEVYTVADAAIVIDGRTRIHNDGGPENRIRVCDGAGQQLAARSEFGRRRENGPRMDNRGEFEAARKQPLRCRQSRRAVADSERDGEGGLGTIQGTRVENRCASEALARTLGMQFIDKPGDRPTRQPGCIGHHLGMSSGAENDK